MSAVAAPQRVTVHETLQLNELIRIEAAEVQRVQAMLPMIADPELKQQLNACLQTGRAHLKALVDYCRSHNMG